VSACDQKNFGFVVTIKKFCASVHTEILSDMSDNQEVIISPLKTKYKTNMPKTSSNKKSSSAKPVSKLDKMRKQAAKQKRATRPPPESDVEEDIVVDEPEVVVAAPKKKAVVAKKAPKKASHSKTPVSKKAAKKKAAKKAAKKTAVVAPAASSSSDVEMTPVVATTEPVEAPKFDLRVLRTAAWRAACMQNGYFQKKAFAKVPKKTTPEHESLKKRQAELIEEWTAAQEIPAEYRPKPTDPNKPRKRRTCQACGRRVKRRVMKKEKSEEEEKTESVIEQNVAVDVETAVEVKCDSTTEACTLDSAINVQSGDNCMTEINVCSPRNV
jgi:hypothetical protein